MRLTGEQGGIWKEAAAVGLKVLIHNVHRLTY